MTDTLNPNVDETDSAKRASALFHQRYRHAGTFDLSAMNPVIESMLDHRTVRSYRADPVRTQDIQAAVAAAQSAPSSSNLQPWSVVTVTDPARKSRLAKLCNDQKQIHQAPLFMIWIVDLARLRQISEIEKQTADGLDYLELFLNGVVDLSLAAQNAVVAFESMGYGTCYIGSARSNPIELSAELGLPAETFPIFGLTVGVPQGDRAAAVKPRLPQQVVIHSEVYDPRTNEESFAEYNQVMSTFQNEQGMLDVSWTRKSSDRYATASALKNRDKLRGFIEQRGFLLK